MARRTKIVTSTFGRDKGKDFLITEMDAFSGEEWARDAVSSVYRCAVASDQPILGFISHGLRELFTAPPEAEIALPSDGSLTHDSPVIKQAKKEAQESAEQEKEDGLNSSPMQIAATLGIRLFMQLPDSAQNEIMRPLLACVSFDAMGKHYPVLEGGKISDVARTYIEEAATVAFLKAEAFRLHSDFFTPAVPSIYARMMAAAQSSLARATSPEPSPQP